MNEINEEIESLTESFNNIAKTEDGLKAMYLIMLNLGYFSPIFTTDKNIYRNAALADMAKWLENLIDEANPQGIKRIKDTHNYYLKER